MKSALTILVLSVFLNTCTNPPSLLEQVKTIGELRVVTRESSSTFYEGPNGPVGLEFDLANRFAAYLNVDLVMYAPQNFSDVLPQVLSGEAHVAAAGLSITGPREQYLKFGPTFMESTPQLLYRYGSRRPKSLDEVMPEELTVVSASSHDEQLMAMQVHHPELQWAAEQETDAEELIYRVNQGQLRFTVADSTDVLLNRYFYPNIRPAFDLKAPEPIAWAFKPSRDTTLFDQSVAFFEFMKTTGELEELKERHFGHTSRFDFVGSRLFLRHTRSRLPDFQENFEAAAEEFDLPWQLLASIGYQESHWNPRAVSPTGVRGIMMLTQGTARQMGVSNRTDPVQSINGGAKYFARVKRKIPERIPDPDRTWMALASYNVGYGHLEDARILTEMHGKNPDRWADVREHLPLLSQKKWYSRVKRGYARGWEPVLYVDNIRSYYETLLWQTSTRNYGAIEEGQAPTPESQETEEQPETADVVVTT